MKISLSSTPLIPMMLVVSLVGAGCFLKKDTPSPASSNEPSGITNAVFQGLTPEQVTQQIHFVPGSVIHMRQTILGLGPTLAKLLPAAGQEAARLIVIDRFAPQNRANLSWQLTTKVEADSSKAARAEAQKTKKPIPEPVMVDRATNGQVEDFDLQHSHSLYLPAFWPEIPKASSLGRSGLWLSSDVYEDLARTRISTLDFGVLDPDLTKNIHPVQEYRNAILRLAQSVGKIENRVDVNRMQGEQDLVEWPLTINGEAVNVQAIRAKNWFGEIVVLNSKENPLVLKVSLSPEAVAAAELTPGKNFLSPLVEYQVTALSDVKN